MASAGRTPRFRVVDLYSGGGGMSYGFAAHPDFELVAAFDAERGKPSSAPGSLGCNGTYELNIGLAPHRVDLGAVEIDDIARFAAGFSGSGDIDVLCACPPCTGFSRANPDNHVRDDARNSLGVRVADWVQVLRPAVVLMENARELLSGNFAHHFGLLRGRLLGLGYKVHAANHMLSDFGLPQRRERALVVACREDLQLRDLADLWAGHSVRPEALTVWSAIADEPGLDAGCTDPDDPWHTVPSLRAASLARLRATPRDGGSWIDLRDHGDADKLLTPAMKRSIAAGRLGSHPDVYGRMAWHRPAATIKRECAHIGNGRYAHPEQDRLLSVREMGLLNGFPGDYRFAGRSLSNMYRHIGDAVPPLISHQLAWVARWMLTGERPALGDCVLAGTTLGVRDLVRVSPVPAALIR